ncbi:hypothetical protein L6R52_42310 [Myxococcota bacterium]|nr:hypothetical protein [Myxococcota bacterium]
MRWSWCIPILVTVAAPLVARAEPIPRERIIRNAERAAYLEWTASEGNTKAPCAPDTWSPDFAVGAQLGVAYKWGGFDTPETFVEKITRGLGAGSHSDDGSDLACVTGADCSGFVSRVWEVKQTFGTATIHQITKPITFAELLPGDALVKPGSHIVLFAFRRDDGVPVFYEASGSASKVRLNSTASWAYLNGYRAIRFRDVVDGPIACTGTPTAPITIAKVPFRDDRSLVLACSDTFDRYACKPSAKESGPELVYTFELRTPAKLKASVVDPPGVDVDLHLLRTASPDDCLARHDERIEAALEPGRYFLVADTFTDRENAERAGPFRLDVDLVATTPGASALGGATTTSGAMVQHDAGARDVGVGATTTGALEGPAGADARPTNEPSTPGAATGARTSDDDEAHERCACTATTRPGPAAPHHVLHVVALVFVIGVARPSRRRTRPSRSPRHAE